MLVRLIIFLLINFGALAVGSMFTGKGVPSEWYQNLNKAPWTPPGWVFGFAWTTIMICFSIFMMYAWESIGNKKLLIGLFAAQIVLNIIWNPLFFKYQQVLIALIAISLLTVLVGVFLFLFISELKLKVAFVLPYFVWLLIATSLNYYILQNN